MVEAIIPIFSTPPVVRLYSLRYSTTKGQLVFVSYIPLTRYLNRDVGRIQSSSSTHMCGEV